MTKLKVIIAFGILTFSIPAFAQTIIQGPGVYQNLGSQTFGPNGAQQHIGGQTFMPDGTSYNRIGDQTFGSDGTTFNTIGGTTFGSNGTTSQTIGGSTFISGPNGNSMVCQTIGTQTFCN